MQCHSQYSRTTQKFNVKSQNSLEMQYRILKQLRNAMSNPRTAQKCIVSVSSLEQLRNELSQPVFQNNLEMQCQILEQLRNVMSESIPQNNLERQHQSQQSRTTQKYNVGTTQKSKISVIILQQLKNVVSQPVSQTSQKCKVKVSILDQLRNAMSNPRTPWQCSVSVLEQLRNAILVPVPKINSEMQCQCQCPRTSQKCNVSVIILQQLKNVVSQPVSQTSQKCKVKVSILDQLRNAMSNPRTPWQCSVSVLEQLRNAILVPVPMINSEMQCQGQYSKTSQKCHIKASILEQLGNAKSNLRTTQNCNVSTTQNCNARVSILEHRSKTMSVPVPQNTQKYNVKANIVPEGLLMHGSYNLLQCGQGVGPTCSKSLK